MFLNDSQYNIINQKSDPLLLKKYKENIFNSYIWIHRNYSDWSELNTTIKKNINNVIFTFFIYDLIVFIINYFLFYYYYYFKNY